MPRRNMEFVEGEIYHLFNRGVNRSPLFLSPENYNFFQRKCRSYSNSLDIPILAICLMPNHYHLVVMQNADNPAGTLAQRVCNSYAKAFNKMMNRTGALFEGRYRVKHIAAQSYLERLCAYIHLNPVIAGLVTRPESWPYSDYHRWIDIDAVNLNHHYELGLTLERNYQLFVDDVIKEKEEFPLDFQ